MISFLEIQDITDSSPHTPNFDCIVDLRPHSSCHVPKDHKKLCNPSMCEVHWIDAEGEWQVTTIAESYTDMIQFFAASGWVATVEMRAIFKAELDKLLKEQAEKEEKVPMPRYKNYDWNCSVCRVPACGAIAEDARRCPEALSSK